MIHVAPTEQFSMHEIRRADILVQQFYKSTMDMHEREAGASALKFVKSGDLKDKIEALVSEAKASTYENLLKSHINQMEAYLAQTLQERVLEVKRT